MDRTSGYLNEELEKRSWDEQRVSQAGRLVDLDTAGLPDPPVESVAGQ